MRKGFSQEGLKLIACITMLIDHIGYALVYPAYQQLSATEGADNSILRQVYLIYLLLRCVGRLSFPIFAFLLAEGFHRTRNRKKYALRLVAGALLAEIPFNLVVSGSPVWRYQQSVMITLLVGFLALLAMEQCRKPAWKPIVMFPFALFGEMLNADYGWGGVVLIALFELSRYTYNQNLVRFLGMLVLFHHMPSSVLRFGNFSVPMQTLGALSMLFIAAYNGRKIMNSKCAQWAFYLFYPVHLLALYLISLEPSALLLGIHIVN